MQEIIEPQIQVFLEKGRYQHPDVRIQGTVIGVKTLIDLLLDALTDNNSTQELLDSNGDVFNIKVQLLHHQSEFDEIQILQ